MATRDLLSRGSTTDGFCYLPRPFEPSHHLQGTVGDADNVSPISHQPPYDLNTVRDEHGGCPVSHRGVARRPAVSQSSMRVVLTVRNRTFSVDTSVTYVRSATPVATCRSVSESSCSVSESSCPVSESLRPVSKSPCPEPNRIRLRFYRDPCRITNA